MSKIVILGTSGNYAASTSSSSANTATTPDILADGTIGIYGLAGLDATTPGNNSKFLLITESTSATGKIADSDFVTGGGELINIAQGTATNNGMVGLENFSRLGIKNILKKAYVAPVRQVTFVGYNGSTGALNLPTIANGDSATVVSIENANTTPWKIRDAYNYDAGYLLSTDTSYSVLAKIANDCNSLPTDVKVETAFVTSDGSQADFTGTATAILFTKGSKTAAFVIQDGTSGWVASTGTIAAGDVIGVAHDNMISVTFTADALGSSAGHHVVTIGGTIYNVADAGTAAQNATAIAAAINAGTQATASVATAAVTIVMKDGTVGEKILVTYSADDSTWATATLTINTTTGETVGVRYKASAAVSAAASFELDYEFEQETGYYLGGTSLTLMTGVVTSITQYGLKLTVDNGGDVFGYALQGILENATLTYSVNPTEGFGTYAQVAAIEKGELAYRGQFDTVDRRMRFIPEYAVSTTKYDGYALSIVAPNTNPSQISNNNVANTFYVMIPQSHSAQTSFETIIKVLAPDAVVNF